MPTTRDYLTDPSLGLVREVRQSQVEMGTTIEEVIENGGIYMVEGPVGVGKTYGYLLPTLLSGKRAVVSTPKKSLQEQIVRKDLPALQNVLKINTNVALLKGMNNYVCQLAAAKHPANDEYIAFISKSKYGDRSDFKGISPKWLSTATAEDCVGSKCKFYGKCGFIALKKSLKNAKIVVVNHHLLGRDFGTDNHATVGGPYEILIVDEAHKLEEAMRSVFTLTISDQTPYEISQLIAETPFNIKGAHKLAALWSELMIRRTKLVRGVESAYPIFQDGDFEEVKDQLEYLLEELKEAGKENEDLSPHESVSLDKAYRAVYNARRAIGFFQGKPYDANKNALGTEGEVLDIPEDKEVTEKSVEERNDRVMQNIVLYEQETGRDQSTLYAAPINLSFILKQALKSIKSVVLTSATLAVNGGFDHLVRTTGVKPTATSILPTSFNYAQQGIVYAPKDITYVVSPRLSEDEEKKKAYKEYINRLIDECATLITASRGNAFILTTSNDEMITLYKRLKQKCTALNILMQTVHKHPLHGTVGDGEPTQLLETYLNTDNAVLLGSKSFWEGVDVQGERLRLVIIVKLPFPAVGDPIVLARRSRYEDKGVAFMEVDFVDMLIDLRQGVGRLIRSIDDRGVVAILDNRVWTKRYGGDTRRSLPFPPNSTTHIRAHVEAYLPKVAAHFERLKKK